MLFCIDARDSSCLVLSLDIYFYDRAVCRSPFTFLFFFQAEDGIRDLVRSRGLGDVYKRQPFAGVKLNMPSVIFGDVFHFDNTTAKLGACGIFFDAVSYTHLTLPTSDLV